MKTTQSAALYLRSSKDRSDVSIDAQRRELQALATSRGIIIVTEYTDVVESAKDEHRQGFQALLTDLKSPTRAWNTLLMVDTSRLSRRRYVAQVFKHEARKRGVDIVYSKVPETDPITSVILEAVLEAFDEVHSLMSREKGLAGMAENVRQGFRAGGRAPRGYRLRTVATGAVRDGEQVTKSVLETNEDAPLIGRYLKARAAGTPRKVVLRELDIQWASSSMIGVEWNALTYAGHTVWNVHNEHKKGSGYAGNQKRRPRAEWIIQRDTHAPLITDEEAEAILRQLETSTISEAVSKAKSGLSDYLLTGLLRTPSGQLWTGNGGEHYRTKREGDTPGRWLPMQQVDNAVIDLILRDMRAPAFAEALARQARRHAAASGEDPAQEPRREIISINVQISKAMDLALQLEDPAPALRKVNELEAKRRAIADEVARLEREYTVQSALAHITDQQVTQILSQWVADFEALPRERWKMLIQKLIDRIVLDPVTLDCHVHYRIAVEDRLSMASPRGFEPLLPP